MSRNALIVLILLLCSSAAQAERLHKLKGRIIRSLAVEMGDHEHFLVGQKAGKPGSGLVFQSLDGGKTWRTLNGNKPLAPEANDVQAVAALSKNVLLAGTWKHGLYVSRNGGAHFERVKNFPSKDIRDLQISGNRIYAATAGHGVFESSDAGRTWLAIGPGSDFLWSITAIGAELYASSLNGHVRVLQGDVWSKVFEQDKAYAIAAAGEQRAIAGETGLYVSLKGDWQKQFSGEKFADVVFADDGRLIAGSWSNGIAVVRGRSGKPQRLLGGKAVVHVQIAGDQLLAGTWGDGLHILPFLAGRLPDQIPLIKATLRNDVAAVSQLLAAGAGVDEYDENRNTALIFAARDGHAELADILLKAGADPDWRDGEQVTPLILAAFKNHIDVVRLLLARDVDRVVKDKWRRSALDYAARRGVNDPIYQLLVK